MQNWYNKAKMNPIIVKRAKSVMVKEIPSGYDILAHPIMGYVETLNNISNLLQTTEYTLKEKDIVLSLDTGDKIFDTLDDKTYRHWLDQSENYLEEVLKHISNNRYEDAYIAYFFAIKVLKTIEEIARYIVDITPPEDKFNLDENL